MAYYDTCSNCGANLDPGEKCDCEFELLASEMLAIYERYIGRGHCDMIIAAFNIGLERGQAKAYAEMKRKQNAAPDAGTSKGGTKNIIQPDNTYSIQHGGPSLQGGMQNE